MNFERRGFIFKGMFDANPELVGKDVRGVKVMPMDQLESFSRENDIDIAVLTIPKTSAVDPCYLEFRSCGSECSRGNSGGERASVRQLNEAIL